MKLSYAWLKTYLPKLPPVPKLVEHLLMHGLDVEDVIEYDAQFDNVVVGEIISIKPHPNADKLRLADVMVSPKGKPLEIVCGAPNIEVGQKVAVALIGTKLPNGLTIEKRAIRGVESNGMICAADELGLGMDHSGVMVLDPKLKVGTPFAQATGFDDSVFDMTTPANRADLMGVRGLAWEIGAILSQQPKLPPPLHPSSERRGQPKEDLTSVSVRTDDQKLCSLFVVRTIRGVTMKPTPLWMVQRLQAAGMRSINIVVDVANYVMLEYGQPLHAYDARKISGHSLVARAAKTGETLKTLDGQTRKLSAEMIVIADGKGPVGIAGVMGGENTEVSDTTTDIYLEAAIFNPVSIRRTSRQLGLVSEASKRFEKGLWPSLPLQASAAAAAIIAEICGGTLEEGAAVAGSTKHESKTVVIDPQYISERLGTTVPAAKAKKILSNLGFAMTGTKTWNVKVPEWRLDVSLPEDIVDEVGRMIGYEDLPKSMPAIESHTEVPKEIRFQLELRNLLVEMGFTEIISHAFLAEHQEEGQHFHVANPLDETQHELRKGVYVQIAAVLARQADAGQDAKIFEIGRVFDPTLPGAVNQQQPWKLAIGLTHKHSEPQLPNLIEEFQSRLKFTIKPFEANFAEKTRGRTIEVCEFDIAALMADAQAEMSEWDPKKFVSAGVRYREQSKYPTVKRDIAFWWAHDEGHITTTIKQLGIGALDTFEIVDRFTKDGRTSYRVNFVYQAPDRTLIKAEVDKLEQKIKDALMNQGAEIR